MPTYEYECQKCGRVSEVFQSMTAEPLKRCPDCRGKLKRLLGSGAGIIFKGSGFYQTDYRSESYRSSVKKETTAPSSTPAAKESGKTPSPSSPPEKKPKVATASKKAKD